MKMKHVLIMAAFLAALLCFPLTVSGATDEEGGVNPDSDVVATEAAAESEGADSETAADENSVSAMDTGEYYDCGHNNWIATDTYVKVDNNTHKRVYICGKYTCTGRKLGSAEEHSFGDEYYEELNRTYHYRVSTCVCGAVERTEEYHNYDSCGDRAIDGTYHGEEYVCDDCGATKIVGKEKHYWYFVDVSRYATLSKKGLVYLTCDTCMHEKTIYPAWKLHKYYSASYDILSHTHVYKKSKSIKVRLCRPMKGGVIKVKIGKKTFTKKIKNKKKTQTVKIKKSKYGKKITIKLYLKGKLVGTDICDGYYLGDHVLYGKNIKKGMSKKKVKNLLYWGPPSETASASGGKSYWYYGNGSWIIFKNGKVKRWYKAN